MSDERITKRDEAQGTHLGSLSDAQRDANKGDLMDLIEDPECRYYMLDIAGQPAAQCVSFPLPPLRGNFDDTIYVSSLAVEGSHRRQGIATNLVRQVLNDALDVGYRFAEVRWHIDNQRATSLWSTLGFRPTYDL